jgi:hypothetical protein
LAKNTLSQYRNALEVWQGLLGPESAMESLSHAVVAAKVPDGHPKLLHLWPVKLLQAGRTDGDYTGVAVMREAASFNR